MPLYDLSPAVRLMLMGVVVALGPLAWIWVRNQNASTTRRLQALTVLTLFLTFDLVIFGAFTRLTDSGLGCPDWPGCYGSASPVGAHADIAAAQAAMPTGPVTHGKAWIEMVHRYLATGVGVLILTLAVVSWVEHRRGGTQGKASRLQSTINPWWPTFTLIWVCLQGAFGALTVTMKLFPAIVTMHLLGGLVLLALLCVQAVRYAQMDRPSGDVRSGRIPLPTSIDFWLKVTFALVVCQIALGGWVSTNYAVLACNEFPMCQGRWWPEMNFAQGFEFWRALGRLQDGSHISFAALTAIHYVHRLMAYVALAALAVLVWRLWRQPGLRRQARWLASIAAMQFATGLSNVVLDWPLVAAVLHTGGAAAMVVVLTWAVCASRGIPDAVAISRLNVPRPSA